MSYLSGAMPKNPIKKRIEAHLMPDKHKRFEDLAKEENRSPKNHLETIILKYLEDPIAWKQVFLKYLDERKKKGGKG